MQQYEFYYFKYRPDLRVRVSPGSISSERLIPEALRFITPDQKWQPDIGGEALKLLLDAAEVVKGEYER